MTIDFQNVKGGLIDSDVTLLYEGSEGQTQKTSNFEEKIRKVVLRRHDRNENQAEENGSFSMRVKIRPSDPPPFDITSTLQIKDGKGRRSNSATAVVHYQ